MKTFDDLKALTKSSIGKSTKVNLAVKFDPDLALNSALDVLEDYFTSVKPKIIKVIFADDDFGYLARADFMTATPMSSRGIGSGDGASLPKQAPSTVKFIFLCCANPKCPKKLGVTNYDPNDPPYCDDHKTIMKPCE